MSNSGQAPLQTFSIDLNIDFPLLTKAAVELPSSRLGDVSFSSHSFGKGYVVPRPLAAFVLIPWMRRAKEKQLIQLLCGEEFSALVLKSLFPAVVER